jgi:cellulose synthase/poly-beta-1,6-N-acetylglucosamine synthase-like glycosyltransferase
MELSWYEWGLAAAHTAISLFLLVYGLNWYVMLFLLGATRRKVQSRQREIAERGLPLARDTWPTVLIQLPVYNEKWVARRVIQAACRLDYPRDKLEIQVLDDSIDETRGIVEEEVARWAAGGITIRRLSRSNREGFKAGALKEGLRHSGAEFVAIFDADFVPAPDWLRRVIPYLLADAKVALVQTRWDHLNREDSLLTRIQALALDGHFAVEQPGRTWGGFLANFNGTAGIWRRAAIDDAGGWEGDTLTEDLDLSYRAQLKGWRIEYLIDVAVPAELPADMRSIASQQFRWAKGGIQTARKLLGRVWRAPIGPLRKLQGSIHLTTHLICPLILAWVLLSIPAWALVDHRAPQSIATIAAIVFIAGFFAPLLMYTVSQMILYERGWRRLWVLPGLGPLWIGIAISNTRAVWQALRGRSSEFVRTPKRGGRGGIGSYRQPFSWIVMWEILAGLYAAVSASLYVSEGLYLVAALLAVYAIGFVTVGLLSLATEETSIARRRAMK